MDMFKVLGGVVLCFFFYTILKVSGLDDYLINGPSFVFVLGGSLAATLLVYGRFVFTWLKTIGLTIAGKEIQTDMDLLKKINNSFAEYCLSLGVLGVLIGVIAMLSNMGDPKQVGPSLAISLYTLFYGIVLNMVSGFLKDAWSNPITVRGNTNLAGSKLLLLTSIVFNVVLATWAVVSIY